MIGEFLLDIVFGIVSGFFALLPEFSWNFDASYFEYFLDILRVVGYMLPMDAVFHIVGMIFGLTLLRIVISFIRALWDILPFA